MKKNKIVGIIIILIAIVYPFVIEASSESHYNESGAFLSYIFTPIIVVFGLLHFVNAKIGMYYSRIVVGSVFIVSGLIKANDTMGFSYKLEEYFEPGALGWSWFNGYELWIAILVCVGEVVLGLALLFGAKFKTTLVFLMGMLVFFAFLTYYTAQCDPNGKYIEIVNGVSSEHPVQCVLDCGCFGDALKGSVGRSLTPWESFYKDLILLILTLFLFAGWDKIKLNNERRDRVILPLALIGVSVFGGYVFGWWFPTIFTAVAFALSVIIKRFYSRPARVWVIAGVMGALTLSFALYTLYYLPIKDYRPYAIGNNLKELKMTSDDIKEELTNLYMPDEMAKFSNEIEAQKSLAVKSDTILNDSLVADSVKIIRKDDLFSQIESTYEDAAYIQATALAEDSMKRGNLFPPVYAVKYILQNKETNEQKEFTSIEYLEQKLWNDWITMYKIQNKETGDVKIVSSETYKPEDYVGYEKVDPISFKVEDGYEPKIPADFTFGDYDIDQHILNSENYILLFVGYDLSHTKVNKIKVIKDLYAYSQEAGYTFYAASASNSDKFVADHSLPFAFLGADDKILKTMVRSNPGVLLLKGGIVKGKWSNASMPSPKRLKKFISNLK